MTVRTYSIPEKAPKDIELDDAFRAYCKKHHLNASAIIVNLVKQFAEDKGIAHE